ncbi:phosphatase PAP2 family protein [Cupriavidus sp. CV2]|uniref:acid phosphatase n=1 Tax=Cupriavidus ulmosensis TaxID=3065913 RepID=UPI00296AFA78|nr:phosphatase PAP2 family protein [Cupriavidus sp. CV2]MDW3682213.1 phosphatase PAP2 family protein [Cupriavidus sp. CV2]
MPSSNRLAGLSVLGAALFLAGCASQGQGGTAAAVPEIRPGILAGYLPADARPDSLALVPPPPAPGSAAQALDDEIARANQPLRDTARYRQATLDADLKFPQAAGIFSCALDAPISHEQTPRLYLLLRRTLADAGLSTYGVKNKYARARPFMVNQQPSCTPAEEAMLSKDGSYPSGHNAIGWAWALILAEIAPQQSNAILARGLAYGQSRLVCNVHWQSDATQGRIMGAATVARLQADPTFRADLAAAKAEVAQVRAKGLKPTGDCRAESEALAVK